MENSTRPNKTFIDRIWDLFASIKLAAITFGLIALSSIIGTVIEQGAEPERNLQVLTKIFGESLAPSLYRISETLGFMDMYHSWWFIAFLVIFTVNLIVCSIERLPNRWRIANQPINPLHPDKFSSYPIKHQIPLNVSPDRLRGKVRGAVKKLGFNAQELSEDNTTQFYSQKGAYGRLGVYVTHLSIILIFIGAVIGIFFGFNGFLNLPEGYTSEVAYSRKGGTAHPLGFRIKCDDFDVEFYKNSDAPKDYKSWLTISENGQIVKKEMIEVNTPLKYKGYTFYQSSYGVMPDPQGIFVLNVIPRGGRSEVANLRMEETFSIPGSGLTGKITNFSPALAFRQDGSTYTYGEMMNNPAVFVTFTRDNDIIYEGWLLKRYPQTWTLPDGNRVEFIDYWGSQYTGLQVRKDPGVWIVYLACLIMAIGLYATFFISHRKIWVAIMPEGKNGSRVLIAATSNKNRPSFEMDIEKMVHTLTKGS